jgi:hypothetical protein
VVRADAPYTRSLVDLYREAHARPPASRSPRGGAVRAGLAAGARLATADIGGGASAVAWPLPAQAYFHVGNVIVLAKRPPVVAGRLLELRARAARSEDLGQLLFVRLEVHKMKEYLARVKTLVGQGLQ